MRCLDHLRRCDQPPLLGRQSLLPSSHRVVMFAPVEEIRRLLREQPLPHQHLELNPGVFDLTVVFVRIDLAQVVNQTALSYLDTRVHGLRMDIEQKPIGPQTAVDLSQGMDHALQGNASQRVGEDRGVKRIIGEPRLGDVAHLEPDLGSPVI